VEEGRYMFFGFNGACCSCGESRSLAWLPIYFTPPRLLRLYLRQPKNLFALTWIGGWLNEAYLSLPVRRQGLRVRVFYDSNGF